MRVLLCGTLTRISFLSELSENLTARGVSVDFFDPASFVFFENNFSRKVQLSKPEGRVARNVWRMKHVFDLLSRRQAYDVVNIHFISRIYLSFILILKAYCDELIITVWGSDFNAASNWTRHMFRPLVHLADKVTFANETMRIAFVEFFGKAIEKKTRICRFGITRLDVIDRISDNKTPIEIRQQFSLSPTDKIVSCGYSACRGQQLEKVIAELEKLPSKLKESCFFIFPMTYGDLAYREEIKRLLASSSLKHRVLTEFLSDEEMASYRIISDVCLQLRTMDSFSASMQESLYARSLVIYGSWLPYDTFAKNGIAFWSIDSIDELNRAFVDLLTHYEERWVLTQGNPAAIRALSSWESTIHEWLSVYGGTPGS